MATCNFGHEPVLLAEVIRFLQPSGQSVIVDCTCGPGGHAEAVLQSGARVIAIDRDEDALAAARKRLEAFIPAQLELIHGNFKEMARILDEQSVGEVDGILADLGLSSLQVDTPARGFSFSRDAALDMRMDRSTGRTAADLLGRAREDELATILMDYGQERYARRIARAVVTRRKRQPIETTRDLVDVVLHAIPGGARRRGRIHPATRTFQALRIAVNGELDNLDRFFSTAPLRLKAGGRICAISYHSLEDAVVKRTFRALARPVSGEDPPLRLLTAKPVRPSAEETRKNPRSRSARLRAAERT
jgi:16S rRNA (cytosine1402-N4)-methyltransferase